MQNTFLETIDNLLNGITMYRLLLYVLFGFIIIGCIASFIVPMPFTPLSLMAATLLLIIACWFTNTVLASIFKAQTNLESSYISALILACIITPNVTVRGISFLVWAAIWTIASKYFFTRNKKHIANPVAVGVWVAGLGLNQFASWWIGTSIMLPFVLIGGLLIVRKIRREDMVFAFLFAEFIVSGLFTMINEGDLGALLTKTLLETPLLFFAFVMLTEPLSTPPTTTLQVYYGALVGLLSAPQITIAGIHTTPESALILGNIASYLISPKEKLFLFLRERKQLASNIFDYVFDKPKGFSFTPGQFMEWTLPHDKPDDRGTRRYFTLASSPTEPTIRIGVRIDTTRSSMKHALANVDSAHPIVAAQTAGEFVLPKNKQKPLVFIAGGIGVTPFRSMIKYLIDTKENRSVTLLYSAETPEDFVYTDIFSEAQKALSSTIIYTITGKGDYPNWTSLRGRITKDMLLQLVPHYKECMFYLSGPQKMVQTFQHELKALGITHDHIKIDYFTGFS